MEETFKKFQQNKKEQEAQYLIERTNQLKKKIHSYFKNNEEVANSFGFNNSNAIPNNRLNLKLNDTPSPNKIVDVKDLLRAQIEEKKLLEIQEKIKDQDYINFIQKRDKSINEEEYQTRMKSQQKRKEYLKDLQQQIKSNEEHKLHDFEMNVTEKKLNRQRIKEMLKNHPERHKRKQQKLELLKSRNKENYLRQTPKTFSLVQEPAPSQIKTLDFTKDIIMPDIKKEPTINTTYQPPSPPKYPTRTPSIPSRNYHYSRTNDIKQPINITHRVQKHIAKLIPDTAQVNSTYSINKSEDRI
jgi:hypothetical protein